MVATLEFFSLLFMRLMHSGRLLSASIQISEATNSGDINPSSHQISHRYSSSIAKFILATTLILLGSQRASFAQTNNLTSVASDGENLSTKTVKPLLLSEKPTEQKILKLELSEIVNLALENNRTIKNAYLQRIIDRQDLAVAEDRFVPNFTPTVSADQNTDTFEAFSVSSTAGVILPTGGELNLTSTGIGLSSGNGFEYQINYNQPLFRGFGIGANMAPIEIAELQETVNILELKSTLSNTVTEAIEAYRTLYQAQEQVKIEQLALERTKEQAEMIRALIEAGILARVELVQSKTDIASRKVSLLEARNQLAQVCSDLIEVLDIDPNLKPVAVSIHKSVESSLLDPEKLKELAFHNNPEYLQTLALVEAAKLGIVVAENQRRWGLNLLISYRSNTRNVEDTTTGLRAGLILTREFGNLTLEQSVERSQVIIQQARNNLQDVRESLAIQIENRVRDFKNNYKQTKLAARARELSELQLENEREKLRLGVSGVRSIDLLNFENDLVQAKNTELTATINYLNALTRLEQTVGIILEKWDIEVEKVNEL